MEAYRVLADDDAREVHDKARRAKFKPAEERKQWRTMGDIDLGLEVLNVSLVNQHDRK